MKAAKCYPPLWHPSFGQTNLRPNVCHHQYDDSVGTIVCVEHLEHVALRQSWGKRKNAPSPIQKEELIRKVRKVGKQENISPFLSCFPAFLINSSFFLVPILKNGGEPNTLKRLAESAFPRVFLLLQVPFVFFPYRIGIVTGRAQIDGYFVGLARPSGRVTQLPFHSL